MKSQGPSFFDNDNVIFYAIIANRGSKKVKNWGKTEMESGMYHCGEPIIAARIQEEPWYSDYQAVCEVMCAGPHTDQEEPSFFEEETDGKQRALEACKKWFAEFPGTPDWVVPDDQRIMRWIDSCWMNESDIQKIKDMFEEEKEGRCCI